ncbi:MAG: GNAT family N-acetyltransferase [Clostridiaceae bacterium]|nr:GNAT family N-acetyltransferase [Clostridiaceae bacterium]
MSTIDIVTGGRELLDFVKPLWEQLNKHHEENSRYFPDRFRNLKFEDRKKKFIDDTNTQLRIDLVKDQQNQIFVGYCISTITIDLVGEIDSLYIEKEYRKYGIGDKLMCRALEWLESGKAGKKVIGIAEGNEQVFEFYKKYGFREQKIILEQVIR